MAVGNLPRFQTAEDAVKAIKSADRVFVQGSAATPLTLINALVARHNELHNVELVAVSTFGEIPFESCTPGSFFMNSLFVSANTRGMVNGPAGDYVPVFLSEINRLFESGVLLPDVALVHVSPPDKHGYCSLGTSVDITRAAVKSARTVIAQVNPQMPRTLGDGIIHISQITVAVQVNDSLPEIDYSGKTDDTALNIGRRCAALIDDGATLQMGIGAIPDAVLSCLENHKDLGIHTEMFSDGVIPLVERGVITNRFKRKHRGKIVTAFVAGTRKLYDFVDDNPLVAFLEASYVNDATVIRSNPRVVAINSAIEIDLTGQVCADSIGTYQYSGVGGQMDFIRGAALSEGGKPVIAMRSTFGNGGSRIVSYLRKGSGVVTSRAHVHYVVTEYGSVNLFGKNLRERALAMLRLAHPSHREELEKAIFNRFGSTNVFIGHYTK